MSEPNENDVMTEDKLDKLIQGVVKKPRPEADPADQGKGGGKKGADQDEVTIELDNGP